MPRKYELYWFKPQGRKTGRWRKRYNNATFYMTADCNGKHDREGYGCALAEWLRVKAWQDGLAPCPYTESGVLIPEDKMQALASVNGNGHVPPATRSVRDDDPEWLIGRDFGAAQHTEAVVRPKSFKHLRKTSANFVEKWNPALTGLFLSHAERGVKKHYVNQHFDELFKLTDRLGTEVYKLGNVKLTEAA